MRNIRCLIIIIIRLGLSFQLFISVAHGDQYRSKTSDIAKIKITKKTIEQMEENLKALDASPYAKALELRNLASAYANKNEYDKAIKALHEVIETKSLSLYAEQDILLQLAQLYSAIGQFQQVIRTIDKMLAHDNEVGPQTYIVLGNAYIALEQYQNTLDAFQKAPATAIQKNEDFYRLSLFANYKLSRFDECINILQKLIDIFPDRKEYWVQLSSFYSKLKDYENALAVMEVAYQKNLLEGNQDLILFAQLFMATGAPYKGGVYMQSWLDTKRVKASADNLTFLASLWLQAREIKRAVPPLAEALRLTDKGKLYLKLSQLYIDTENWPEAIKLINRALTKAAVEKKSFEKNKLPAGHPAAKRPPFLLDKMSNLYLLLGIAHYHQEEIKEAGLAFLKAAQSREDMKPAREWLAYLYSNYPQGDLKEIKLMDAMFEEENINRKDFFAAFFGQDALAGDFLKETDIITAYSKQAKRFKAFLKATDFQESSSKKSKRIKAFVKETERLESYLKKAKALENTLLLSNNQYRQHKQRAIFEAYYQGEALEGGSRGKRRASFPCLVDKNGLTLVGAIARGNYAGDLPAIEGSRALSCPENFQKGVFLADPYGEEDVLFRIDHTNMDEYENRLTPGQMARLRLAKHYYMNIYPTHRNYELSKKFLKSTQKSRKSARIDKNLNLSGYKGGLPFPVPENGIEAIFNVQKGRHFYDMKGTFTVRTIAPSGRVTPHRLKINMITFENQNRPSRAKVTNPDLLSFAAILNNINPSPNAGTALMIRGHSDYQKGAAYWVYRPSFGQVKGKLRKIGHLYDGSTPISKSITYDDILGVFAQELNEWSWKLIGRRELYIPANNYNVWGKDSKIKKPFPPLSLNPENIRYELRRVWAIEQTPIKGAKYPIGKRVTYYDEDSWNRITYDNYDRKGNLLGLGEQFTAYDYCNKLPYWNGMTTVNLKTGHYDVLRGDMKKDTKSFLYNTNQSPAPFTLKAFRRANVRPDG